MIARTSKPAHLGAALSSRLFAAGSVPGPTRVRDDPQGAIRSAIRRRRRTLGLTQEQAAALMGLSRLSYHRIESGRRRLRAAELAALCAAYNCHIGEIVQDGALARAFLRVAPDLFGDAGESM